ncbi:cell division protein ZapA [Calidifontibacillus oryziterrae]|uniref:cell division protein ZapA n=1 Tax=Calidifontibacillus oryziterrae TaxID=1191699 RepID=UPI00030DC082|nr:cell division protein ZapA [Calidifontibacillus oryziterrae]
MTRQNSKRISVDIYGHQYTIVGDENSSHIRVVSSIVDDKMREIHEMNPNLDTQKLAVLTAINIVNDYLNIKNEHEALLRDYQRLLEKIEKGKD